MSGRKCGNCRHYEPSPIWRSGWCRNPRLYGPQESHLVRQEELACAHRIGNYWEAAEDDVDGPGDRPGHGLLAGIVKPLRLFGPGSRLVAATSGPPGGGRFGSGVGGSGGTGSAGGSGPLSSSGSGRDPYGTGGGGSAAGGQPPQPGFGAPGRPDPTGRLPGQERSVSYQPEERYWTDYLRIALPVVGLLLMLGLFWFWAANLIADDDDDDPPATIEVSNVPTATATTVVAGGAQTPADPPTQTPVNTEDDETPPPDEEEETAPPDDAEDDPPPDDGEDEDPPPDDGADDPADDSPFPIGSEVIVNTDSLNFRPAPNTTSEPIRELANGEELEVTGPIETDSAGIEFLPVVDADGVAGYVAAQFVELA